MMKLFKRKKPKKETVSCAGCKHLDYYNDGSALCTKSLEKVCIPNGFSCREAKEMNNQKALEAFKRMYEEIDKEKWLSMVMISPEMVMSAIKALEKVVKENEA